MGMESTFGQLLEIGSRDNTRLILEMGEEPITIVKKNSKQGFGKVEFCSKHSLKAINNHRKFNIWLLLYFDCNLLTNYWKNIKIHLLFYINDK